MGLFGRSDICICGRCGNAFDPEDSKMRYESYFNGELDWDDDYSDNTVCADCAIAESESLINQGSAIMMMNGDEDYDDDFVNKWL